MSRPVPFTYDADHPTILVGPNQGPTPVELLLHAIATCVMSGLANIAAAQGITLRRVSSTVEGDIDLLGILGLSDVVRNGYRQIRVHFDVEGDASPEKLSALVEQSRRVPLSTMCWSTAPMSRSMSAPLDLRSRWDVIIIGGRVAGASTALLVARAGLRVFVVERTRRGSDPVSTHALMRGGVLQLHRWRGRRQLRGPTTAIAHRPRPPRLPP